MAKTLTKKSLTAAKKILHCDWKIEKSGSLSRLFTFRAYLDGLMFISKISVHAAVHKHYPSVTLELGSVTATFTQTETKPLALSDFSFAKTLDEVYQLSTTKEKRR